MRKGRHKFRNIWRLVTAPQPWSASTRERKHIAGKTSACLSGLGLVCVVLGCSGPSTLGLTGKALKDAYQANEHNILWLIIGEPLSVIGLLVGMYNARSWYGKAGMALAVLAGVWVWTRQDHF